MPQKTILFLLLCFFPALSGTPQEEGRALAEKSDALFRGFGDETGSMVMHLINSKGDTVVRKTKSLTLERPKKEDYSLIFFEEPADVRGTGMLTYQNPAGDDKQWLYLPELRRVKKISSKNKSGSFMGSEFAYEDITGNTLDKFTYTKTGEEKLNGKDCLIVEKVPTYKNSGYTKIKMWMGKDDLLLVRQEYTDRKNTLLKVQTFSDYEKVGHLYRIGTIRMENIQTKKVSVINFKDRKLKQGLKEKDFSKSRLQRGL